ncbi:sensor histidine kinase [Paenibacillus harenae]|uniref:Two-component system sensor histidine kinase YesM n=1 Tax=Paenibacillus harenae TaxID=306543 RepID=A0ABT9U1A9_PAEHA|nr:sensor histidine kinase [Paenibacillus harenae]MDQ0112793.1 two-component system sensor histidine kinase YesM [Paenibacillus harenae]
MFGHFRKISLIKQIVYLILIMLIILLISFIVSNSIAKSTVELKVTESATKIMLQVEETITSFYKDMDGISYSLLYSPTIQSYLGTNEILSRILMNNDIASQFSSTLALKENIRGIQIYDNESKMIASEGRSIEPLAVSRVSDIRYSGIMRNASGGLYYTIAVPIYNLQNNYVLKDYRGMSLFIMDVSNFDTILNKSKITPNAKLMLLDNANKIISSTNVESVITDFDTEAWRKDSRYIVQEITLSYTGWKIVSVIPKDELLQDLDTVKQLNVATYVIIFSIFCLFLLIFYGRILKPVKSLLDFVKSYAKSGGRRRFNIVYHNEIGVLADNLNKMLDDIDMLSSDVQIAQKQMYEAEIVKKQMEIAAYRNQINPHFLYNTLECIRAMAFYYKADDIADISASLSNMFRYSVKGDNIVTVQDEIAHLKEYAAIIDFRFRGKIQVVIQADETLLAEQTLKMLLQPIVENAVFHGLERKIDPGKVTVIISRTSGNRIRLSISDNGLGMNVDKLKELKACLHQFEEPGFMMNTGDKGIGLANIYRRMKLFYGDQADMEIESDLNTGTTVSIAFLADKLLLETGDAAHA